MSKESKVKKFTALANSMVGSTKKAIEDIKAEGRSKEWEQNKIAELKKKTREHAQKIVNDMREVANMEAQEAKNEAKEARVRQGNSLKQMDSAAKLYHQNNAKMALDGLSPDEAIEAYPRIIDNLTEQEREHLHCYEDVLLYNLKGEGDRNLAESVVYKHKTPAEKVALEKANKAEEMLYRVDMVANHFLHDILEVADGDSHPGYDYSDMLLDDKAPEVPGDGTPYDGGSNDHPDLH